MVIGKLPAELAPWITALGQPLHRRHAWRLLPLVAGLLFAQGRRTVASWLRGAGVGRRFQRYYYFLASLGRKADFVASLLLRRAAAVLPPGERVLLSLDDTPTKRYGPQVEGAGRHHNPPRARPARSSCTDRPCVTNRCAALPMTPGAANRGSSGPPWRSTSSAAAWPTPPWRPSWA